MQANNQLALALHERDKGVRRVASKNGTFLETMRGVARLICRQKGSVTADDLREWAGKHGIEPTHYNAWGAVFLCDDFYSDGRTKSNQKQGHGNDIRIWKLRHP
jgi:hypothetical protein